MTKEKLHAPSPKKNKEKIKEEQIHVNETVEISPTGTVSAAGEVAQGAIGTFSFDELLGRDLVASNHQSSNEKRGD